MDDALDPAVLSRIEALLAAGNKLFAVREYRCATGAGLQQAMAFIDGLKSTDSAVARAQVLSACAYELCELHRDGKLSYAAVLELLQSRCPGYSQGEYEQARNDGMFASR